MWAMLHYISDRIFGIWDHKTLDGVFKTNIIVGFLYLELFERSQSS